MKQRCSTLPETKLLTSLSVDEGKLSFTCDPRVGRASRIMPSSIQGRIEDNRVGDKGRGIHFTFDDL